MNEKELTERIATEFGCKRSEARVVAEKAIRLKERVESNPETWDGPDINSEYIINILNMASDQLSVTGKWNWWAGSMNYFDGTPRDFRIK